MIETLLIFLIAVPIAYATITGAPFVASRKRVAERMIEEAELSEDDIAYDLGAGNGRFIVLAEKKFNRKIYGIELAWPVWLAGKLNLLLRGINPSRLKLGSFYRMDMSKIDVFFCFLVDFTMKRLKRKFEKEAKPGAKIISNNFRIEGWEPKKIVKLESLGTIYVYEVPKRPNLPN